MDDAGYESQENYTFIEQNNQTSFLKTPNYETMKKSSFKRDISKREHMRYDEELNEYTCYNNRKLKPVVNKKLLVSKAFVQKRQQSLSNINTPEWIVLRVNRSIQVEDAFDILKEDYGFRKLYTRGIENVKFDF